MDGSNSPDNISLHSTGLSASFITFLRFLNQCFFPAHRKKNCCVSRSRKYFSANIYSVINSATVRKKKSHEETQIHYLTLVGGYFSYDWSVYEGIYEGQHTSRSNLLFPYSCVGFFANGFVS